MLQTSPPSSVHDVAFPHEYSEVFAACGLGEIRVWHLHSRRELLRISVPNLDCRCVAFMQVCCFFLFASAEACMLLQSNMTRPVALAILIVYVLCARQCYWGMLLGLNCSMQQEFIHAEDDLPRCEMLKKQVQDAKTGARCTH